jgi:hypothetical protein
MASNPYVNVSISGYNSDAPTDDGAQTSNNRITWAKQKTKLADPLKVAIEAMDAANDDAFNTIANILVDFTGDFGSGGITGLVPAPGAGDAANNRFLRADGTWTTPAGAGSVTSVATGSGLTGGPITGSGTISLASIANNTVLGNLSGVTAAPGAVLLPALLNALDVFQGDLGSGGVKGLVPAPAADDYAKFLRGDGTWAATVDNYSGTVTSIATGSGLTGGTITSSGTISLAAISDQTLLVNLSGGSAAPTEHNISELTPYLNAFGGDFGSGGSRGLVPAPLAGDSGKYLRGDGTWVTVSGTGTVTSVNITAPAAGITASGGPVTTSGSITLALADDLAALEGLGSTGLAARTASNTWAQRTITGTSGQITVSNGDGVSGNPTLSLPADVIIPTIITAPNSGLHILDTDASHDLIITPGSNLTADRVLTITTGDAPRTLTVTADATITQDYSTSGSPQFAAINLNHATANTLTASGGHMTIEGATVWDSGNDGAASGLDADLLDGKNTGTSGNAVPLLDGTNTWSGQQTISVGSAATTEPLRLVNTTDNASVQVFQFEGDRATMAANDELYGSWLLSDSAGTQTEFARITVKATTVTDASETGRLQFGVMTSGSLADKLYLTDTALTPAANDGTALGTTSLGFSDLHLASGGVINWVNGEITLTETDANTLTLAGATLVLPASSGLTIGASNPFSDSAGTLTLQNVDAIDSFTESTIEAAIDTLPNLTSIQGRTVTLADAGADRIFGWDDSADAYVNLSVADATAVLNEYVGASAGTPGTKGLVNAAAAGDHGKFFRGDGTWQTIGGGGDMLAANNLSDLTDVPTARSNLGLGSILDTFIGDAGSGGGKGLVPAPAAGDDGKFLKGDGTWSNLAPTLDIGSTDTTLSRASAGRLAVEGATLGPTLGTPVTTTSGTTVDFTNIPSWARRITIMFVGVSTSGTSNPLIQIGDSGGIEATGYLGGGGFNQPANVCSAALFTTGWGIGYGIAANLIHGALTLYCVDPSTFTWVISGVIAPSNTASVGMIAGSKSLSAALDRIRITSVGGTDTFDAGTINIMYE